MGFCRPPRGLRESVRFGGERFQLFDPSGIANATAILEGEVLASFRSDSAETVRLEAPLRTAGDYEVEITATDEQGHTTQLTTTVSMTRSWESGARYSSDSTQTSPTSSPGSDDGGRSIPAPLEAPRVDEGHHRVQVPVAEGTTPTVTAPSAEITVELGSDAPEEVVVHHRKDVAVPHGLATEPISTFDVSVLTAGGRPAVVETASIAHTLDRDRFDADAGDLRLFHWDGRAWNQLATDVRTSGEEVVLEAQVNDLSPLRRRAPRVRLQPGHPRWTHRGRAPANVHGHCRRRRCRRQPPSPHRRRGVEPGLRCPQRGPLRRDREPPGHPGRGGARCGDRGGPLRRRHRGRPRRTDRAGPPGTDVHARRRPAAGRTRPAGTRRARPGGVATPHGDHHAIGEQPHRRDRRQPRPDGGRVGGRPGAPRRARGTALVDDRRRTATHRRRQRQPRRRPRAPARRGAVLDEASERPFRLTVDADELAGRTELTLEAVDRAGNVGDTIRVVEVAEDEALEENEQEEATSPEDAGQAQPVPGLGLVGAIAAGFVAARLYRR